MIKNILIVSFLTLSLLIGGMALASTEVIENTVGVSGIGLTVSTGTISWGVLDPGVGQDTTTLGQNQTVVNASIGIGDVDISMKASDFTDGSNVLANGEGSLTIDDFYMEAIDSSANSEILTKSFLTVYSGLAETASEVFEFYLIPSLEITFSSASMAGEISVMASVSP